VRRSGLGRTATPRRHVVVRQATLRDAAQLATVYQHAFGPETPADVRRRRRRRDPPRETLVAVVDGVIASTVEVQYRDLIVGGVPIRTGGIAGVATRWEYRHHGLATRLMREAIRRVRSRGISNTTLFTGTNLPAIRIYTRLGYSETSKWQVFRDIRRPVDFLRSRFEYRSKWLGRNGSLVRRSENRSLGAGTVAFSSPAHDGGPRSRSKGGRSPSGPGGGARRTSWCEGAQAACSIASATDSPTMNTPAEAGSA